MARNRTTAQQSTQTVTKENTKMANVLDATQIAALLSKQKSRGDYDSVLANFLGSGNAGEEVSLTEGVFVGKKASNIKTGFDNARNRLDKATGKAVHEGGHAIKVIKLAEDDGTEHVYLINTALAGTAAE